MFSAYQTSGVTSVLIVTDGDFVPFGIRAVDSEGAAMLVYHDGKLAASEHFRDWKTAQEFALMNFADADIERVA